METTLKVRERTVVFRKIEDKGWAIVVKEDKVLIDNYHHGFAHIHPDRRKIKYQDLEDALEAVVKHIEKYGKINVERLREEICE